MKMKSLLGLFLSFIALVIVGCGGGGGGGPTSTVAGIASKGPINGGTVQIFAIQNGVQATTPLTTTPATVTTGPDGSYTANVSYTGPALVVITGGSYVDEATGATITLSSPLRAALPNVTGTVSANVTPFTELAVLEALGLGGLSTANITSANAAISNMIGVDILATSPADPTYKLALEVFSQVQLDTNSDLAVALANFSAGITVNADNTVTIDAPTQAVIDTAEANLTTNPNIDPTTLPMNVTLTALPTTGVINGQVPVTISAAVTFAASGLPVPNGIGVNFTIASGTGTLSNITLTAGGIASAVLNSTAAGDVVVSAATATSAAATITVPFIAQPTQAIVRVATSGTLPAGTLIGGIDAVVTFPQAGLSITANDVVVSGVATGSLLAANANTPGQVILGLVNANGIPVGQFGTLTFAVAAGTFPQASDFVIAPGASVITTLGAALPQIGVVIESVTLQ